MRNVMRDLFVMFVTVLCFLFLLIFLCLRVTSRTGIYFHGVFPHPGFHSFQQKVYELAQRQYTASKKQAHVATELTC